MFYIIFPICFFVICIVAYYLAKKDEAKNKMKKDEASITSNLLNDISSLRKENEYLKSELKLLTNFIGEELHHKAETSFLPYENRTEYENWLCHITSIYRMSPSFDCFMNHVNNTKSLNEGYTKELLQCLSKTNYPNLKIGMLAFVLEEKISKLIND